MYLYVFTPRKIAQKKRKSVLRKALSLLSHKIPLIGSLKSQGWLSSYSIILDDDELSEVVYRIFCENELFNALLTCALFYACGGYKK